VVPIERSGCRATMVWLLDPPVGSDAAP
jgi:hypothetical protein